jgi:hypothetical protein
LAAALIRGNAPFPAARGLVGQIGGGETGGEPLAAASKPDRPSEPGSTQRRAPGILPIEEAAEMRFRTTVELGGRTATGIEVPAEVVTGLGSGRRPAVHATIAGHTYRTTIASMGGRFMIPVSAEIRSITGVAAGDEIEVDVELDTEPREVTVPDDLAAALDAEPDARRFFDGLSYSNQRRHVLAVDGAKSPETRARRIAKAVTTLRDGQK